MFLLPINFLDLTHGRQKTQEIRPVKDEIIITAMKFVTYLRQYLNYVMQTFYQYYVPTGHFILNSCHIRNRAIVLSLNLAYFWFA